MSVENFDQRLDGNAPRIMNGRMRRTPLADRFWAKVVKADGCWGWSGTRNQYGRGQISRGGRYGKLAMASHVSWELHHGQIPTGLWVLHKCDNPTCVNPQHLFLGTHQDNMDDAKAKGRMRGGHPPGERHPAAKLTTEQVIAIREDGRSQSKIAAAYGVTQSHISAIKRDKYRKAES